MTSHELRLVLIRQLQTIRKALYVIECNLTYYERIVEEEAREAMEASQTEAGKEKPPSDYPNGSA